MNLYHYYPYQTEEMERRMSEKQRPFKVGDKVFDLLTGNGVVRTIHTNGPYTVLVRFADTMGWYTSDGKRAIADINPSIYHADSGDIVISTATPLPELEVDTPVWVRSGVNEKWIPRHFSQWKDHGCSCWRQGRTSHTADSKICWDYWSLTKPETNE